ncbi:MAG TPA: prolyl oligopeptidase family serine peptidase [Streptomyces sp.]|nr:prolyl oligopeptidase family serine peptidase [Streptomyces sp.]
MSTMIPTPEPAGPASAPAASRPRGVRLLPWAGCAVIAFLMAAGALFTPPAAIAQASGAPSSPDHAWPPPAIRLARELSAAAPSVRWAADGRLIRSVRKGGGGGASAGGTWVGLDPRTGKEAPYTPPELPPGSRPRAVHPGLFSYVPPVFEAASGDGEWFAGTHGGNVWVRSISGDSLRVTTDGTLEDAYDVQGAKWSPDGRLLAVKRLDRRGIPTIPVVAWSAPGQPVTRHFYSRAGQKLVRSTLYVIDREGGEPVKIDLGTGDDPYLNIVGWSPDGSQVYVLRTSRLMKRQRLMAADPRTGRSRTVLEETSRTYVHGAFDGVPFLRGYDFALDLLRPCWLLSDGRRFIWSSSRDGWNRLYLYALDGTLIRTLTPPGSGVERVTAIDEEGEWVYYTAQVDSARPYDVSLARVRLSGGRPQRLVTGPTLPLLRGMGFGPSHDFFWVRRGGIDQPPTIELRRADGPLVRTLWSGDSILRAAGWKAPEQVKVKAADGETDLYGLLFTPRDFDPGRKYPVIDVVYPFGLNVPRTISAAGRDQALADLGFVVMVVDGRGTDGRGTAFTDAFYGEFGQHEVGDQVAALRQLAAERPYMDVDRVGVMGDSWGGYETLRALVLEPELFRVGVAGSPAADPRRFRVSVEFLMGCLPKDCPEAYDRAAVTPLLERLEGKLMILHGTADLDVPFGETMELVSKLREAGKPYTLVIFPGQGHDISWRPERPYWWKRVTEFLKQNLGGPEPLDAREASR